MTPEQEREAFEAWHRTTTLPWRTAWMAWQARASLAQPASVPAEPNVGHSALAGLILTHLGYSTSPSLEPCADGRRDRLAEKLAGWLAAAPAAPQPAQDDTKPDVALTDLIHALDVASYRAGSAMQYHEWEGESPGITRRNMERAERVRQELLAEVIAHVLAAPQPAQAEEAAAPAPDGNELIRPIDECYGDCPTNPVTCHNPCRFEGRYRPSRVHELLAALTVNDNPTTRARLAIELRTLLKATASPAVGAPQPEAQPAMSFADALRIACGCTDYGGGYRGDPPMYEAYQHGINTVINALNAADKRGFSDTQVAALHAIGASPSAQAEQGGKR